MYQHDSPICTNNIPINQHVRKVSPIYTNDIPMNQYVRYVSPIYTNDIPMNQLVRLFQRVLDETGTLQRSERGASSIIKSVTKVVRMMTRKGREDTQQLLFETKLSLNFRFWTRFLDKIKSKYIMVEPKFKAGSISVSTWKTGADGCFWHGTCLTLFREEVS